MEHYEHFYSSLREFVTGFGILAVFDALKKETYRQRSASRKGASMSASRIANILGRWRTMVTRKSSRSEC